MNSTANVQVFADNLWIGGTIAQIATTDATGVCDGTAYLVVVSGYPTDSYGRFFEVRYGGASSPAHAAAFTGAFATTPDRLPVMHLCAVHWSACTCTGGARPVIHVNTVRRRPLCSQRAMGLSGADADGAGRSPQPRGGPY